MLRLKAGTYATGTGLAHQTFQRFLFLNILKLNAGGSGTVDACLVTLFGKIAFCLCSLGIDPSSGLSLETFIFFFFAELVEERRFF